MCPLEAASLPGECIRRQKHMFSGDSSCDYKKRHHICGEHGQLMALSLSFQFPGFFSLGLLNGVFIQKKTGAHSSLLLIAFSKATVPGLIANPGPWLKTRAHPSYSCGSVGVRPPISPGKQPSLLHPMKTHTSSPFLFETPDGKLHSQLGLIHSPTK